MLEGIKRNDWRTRPGAAGERGAALAERGAALAERGEIAYRVGAPEGEPEQNRCADERADALGRTRLRVAKLLDAALRSVCEHEICGRSLTRIRIALARDTSPPRRRAAPIDKSGDTHGAKVVRRRELVVGVRLQDRTSAHTIKPRDRFVLSELYYGLRG